MEVMKDVSILFYRDKCFFSAVKYLYLYHSSWLVHIDVSGQTIKLLQNIYHNSIFWNITSLQIYDMVYN